jgi:ATP-dependent RNA helicase DDX54/DBP10
VKRAKALPKEGIHPELLASLPSTRYTDATNEAELAKFTAALRSFRPAATVLEAEIAPVRATQGRSECRDD